MSDMFHGMGFCGLLGVNMAAAGIIAFVGDSCTQAVEICIRRPPKVKQRKSCTRKDDDEELELWPDEVPEERRFHDGAQVKTMKEIELQMEDGTTQRLPEGILGRVVCLSNTPGAEVRVAFSIDNLECVFEAIPGDVELVLQEHDCWRTLRMVCVGAFVFDPLSFTWYYAILPKLVPGHAGALSAAQMTKKIIWDVVVYGFVVAAVSVTANAGLQACTPSIVKENELRGISKCDHVLTRVYSDLPRLYIYALLLAIPADIPVFMLVPAKWQAAAFKFGDALFMLIVSYVVNSRVGEQDYVGAPLTCHRPGIPAPSPWLKVRQGGLSCGGEGGMGESLMTDTVPQ